jgi:diguanylate cyclase (GGDEF)-like protein
LNLLLDAKTVFISLAIGHLFTFILISAYWHGQTDNLTVRTFALAKWAQTVTWICQGFRGQIPDIISISFSNSILFAGVALEIIALLSLHNALRPITFKLYIYMTALCIIGFQLIFLFNNQENIRIAYASITTALMIIPICRITLSSNNTLLMKIMGYIYLFVAAASLVRGWAAIQHPQLISLMSPGIYQSLSFLSIYLVMILGNTGFVLLWKEKADQELVRLASLDDLTGALNRRTFASRAQHHLEDCMKKGRPVSYLVFDIDWFKSINDTYGHNAGDQVLQDITGQIMRHIGPNDLLVRYGGDEFGILLPGMDEAESTSLAERIRHAQSGAVSRGLPADYTISMGILTVVPGKDTRLETLYNLCDRALYAAKNKGRNNVFRYQANI